MTKEIRHKVTIHATPAEVYAALMDEKKHARFTGAPASIGRRVGTAFACYGNYVTGITVELVPAKRIVQVWRSRGWPKGTYSLVTFKFTKLAGGKTRLDFSHIGVRANDYASKNRGWRFHYWRALKRYLEKRPR